jgi:hypothetical protein
MKDKVIESLKSSYKEEVDGLKAIQTEGLEAIEALEAARAANDEGQVSEASEKVEKIGESIKAQQAKIEALQEQMGWFKEYADEFEVKTEEQSKEDMKKLFEQLKGVVTSEGTPVKKTVGEHFADILEYRQIKSNDDIRDLKADTRMRVLLGKTPPPNAKDLISEGGYKAVKSIYSNQGTALLDGSSNPIPGFMGFQCGLVEDTNLYCLLDPPAEDFEQCITQANLTGNRVRFTTEVARTQNAGAVLETVYNPYPTLARNGTKPEGTFTLATQEIGASKIAEFVVASDEVLEDCGFVSGLIDNFLVSGINREKRRQLIAGTGLNGEMRGILNTSNVLTRTHQSGGHVDDNIYDTFRRGLTDLWLQTAAVDNVCVIMNPRDGEIIDLTKDEFGHYLFNDSDCFNRMLRCLNIRYSLDVPQGTAVLGDFANNWVFYTRKALDIRMGYTGDQFITNTNTILGEMRGLALVRCPRKILKVTGLV